MKSEGKNTLSNGNIPRGRRENGERNKRTRLMEIIGKENYIAICKMHVETALYCDDQKLRASAQAFLIERIEPKPSPVPHQTYIKIPLLSMRSIENIKQNEDTVLKNMGDGFISMEEGKELFSMIEQARKTYETTEIARMLDEIDQRMKESGI